jgi:hypothetical protein
MAAHAYLLPISNREALAWILREQRTAFAEHRFAAAMALEPGDVFLLYATRGCFGNPTRDRGRVIGRALVKKAAERVRRAPRFGGHEYPYLVELSIESLTPFRDGLELAPIVPKLRGTFPDPATWMFRLRRALVPLHKRDAALIERELKSIARPYEESLSSYRAIE